VKSFFSIILLCVLVIPASLKLGIVANYLVDYSAYLEHCENADKPELKCNGKCQLAQELKEASSPVESPRAPIEVKTEPVFFFDFSTSPESVHAPKIEQNLFVWTLDTLDGFSRGLLDPPRA
jgi:hypothetical protein